MSISNKEMDRPAGSKLNIKGMKGSFKQCPNGHYYQGDQCPYCKNMGSGDAETIKTEQFLRSSGYSGNTNSYDPTIEVDPTIAAGGNVRTDFPRNGGRTWFGMGENAQQGTGGTSGPNGPTPRTDRPQGRTVRKMVGWLVSYTLDPMGIDYKLYEGRNIIGQDATCSITVPDPFVSARHAVLLFRADRYSLTDQQSSHGTYVNDEDIELEPRYLEDGDVIKMGKTVFKFKSSL